MKTEDVLQKIKDLEAQLAELKASCEPKDDVKDWPKVGDRYWFINNKGYLDSYPWTDHDTNNFLKSIGNIFRTKQEAQDEIEARKVVAELRMTEGRVSLFIIGLPRFGILVSNVGGVETSDKFNDFLLAWESEEAVEKAIEKVGKDRIIAAAKHLGRL